MLASQGKSNREIDKSHPKYVSHLTKLKELYRENGIDGLHGHFIILKGSTKHERDSLLKYGIRHLHRFVRNERKQIRRFGETFQANNVELRPRAIYCLNKNLTEIENEISREVRENPTNPVIELLALFDISKDLNIFLSDLSCKINNSHPIPSAPYRMFVFSTLKDGEEIGDISETFLDLCAVYDTDERCIVDIKETYKDIHSISNAVPYEQQLETNESKEAPTPPLFLDDKREILYYSEENKVQLTKAETRFLKHMNPQRGFLVEEILVDFFKKDVQIGAAISKEERNSFDVLMHAVNKKGANIGVKKLVGPVEGEKKMFGLNVHLQLKELVKP